MGSEPPPESPGNLLTYLYLTCSLQVEDLIKRLLHSVTQSNHAVVSQHQDLRRSKWPIKTLSLPKLQLEGRAFPYPTQSALPLRRSSLFLLCTQPPTMYLTCKSCVILTTLEIEKNLILYIDKIVW